MSHADRIAQWENMTAADPDNDMGWFSLGTAYKDAERHEDAANALGRAIQINPSMSRAYQLRGQALMALERQDEAADMLTRGYIIAAERGDVMPQRAMGSLLEKMGLPVPQVEKPESEPTEDLGEDAIRDRRTGQMQRRLPDPPMRGPTGKFIYDHFGQATWREWIGMGTKVINELRLDFSNVNHQHLYEQHMLEWLGVTPEEIEAYSKQKSE